MLRELFVHDGDPWCVGRVVFTEIAAREQRDSHRVEVVLVDRCGEHVRIVLAGWKLEALWDDRRRAERVVEHRNRARERDPPDPRNGTCAIGKLPEKLP